MKKHFFLLIMLLPLSMFSQAPQSFSYQGVARNNSGDLLSSTGITVQLKIHDGSSSGTIVYSEQHSLTTNSFGGFNLNVGQGSVLSGTFASVNWASGTKFLEQLIDFGSGLQSVGTTQLLSVPYALEANHANTATTATTAANGLPAGASGQTLRNDGTNWIANSQLFNNGTSIGIGTPSPVSELHIHKPSASNSVLRVTNSTTGSGAADGLSLSMASNGLVHIFQNEVAALTFGTSATERMRITSAGSVGIGTTSPIGTLNLNGSGLTGPSMYFTNDDVDGYSMIHMQGPGGLSDQFHFGRFNSDTFISQGGVAFNDGIAEIYTGINFPGSMVLGLQGNDDLYFMTNNLMRMKIEDDGKIGVGINAPVSRFHLNALSGMNNKLHFTNSNTGITAGDGFEIGVNDASNIARVEQNENASMIFETNNIERMAIGDDGNVGIGTTLPNYPLDLVNPDNTNEAMVNLTKTEDAMCAIRLETPYETWIIGQNNSPGASGLDDFFIYNETDDLDRFMIDGTTGNVGIGITGSTSAAAKLEVAGTVIVGTEGTPITNIIKATVNFDVSSIAAGGSLSEVMAVPNASLDATVFVSPDASLSLGMVIAFARVSSEGNVLVRFTNTSGAAIDPNAMDYHITVIE